MGFALAKAEIAINAPIEEVFRVMLDLSRYHEWNPFIVSVKGAPAAPKVGDAVRLRVRWSNGGGATSGERITRVEPPAQAADSSLRAAFEYVFTGPLDALGLVRATRVQTLDQQPGGPTIYRTTETFHGLLVLFVPLRYVQDGFERHARALKARAESI
jgi:hypothetical protein